jgi:glutaredoxin 3
MKLTVYSMEGCAACVSATKLLESKSIDFEVVKIDENPEAWEFLKKEGHRAMPQIYEGDKLFVAGGFQGLMKHFK